MMHKYDLIKIWQQKQIIFFASLTLTLFISCGKQDKKSQSSPPHDTVDGKASENSSQVPTRADEKNPSQAKIQLSDEAIGIKTGAQIIAHFSQATGIALADFDPDEQEAIENLRKSLPEKNSLETFSAAHPPAALKVATYYCLKLINREHEIQNGNGEGKAPKLPSIDYDSQKPLSPQVAKIFYDPLIHLFAGMDTATLPEKTVIEKHLDEFIERLKNIPPEQNRGPLGAKRTVVGMCTTIAASLVTLWI